jgi:hypothetical protein
VSSTTWSSTTETWSRIVCINRPRSRDELGVQRGRNPAHLQIARRHPTPITGRRADRQSAEAHQQKRKALVWDIDKKLQEDVARPIIYHNRGGTCWQPQLKGLTLMVNSIYNGYRFEDIWLDR